MIKAALLDLDGSLTTEDTLDIACELAGKMEESRALNELFKRGQMTGNDSLVKRINLLKGITVQALMERLIETPYLREGAGELIEYLRSQGIITAILSKNMSPTVKHYQKMLGTTYGIGTAIDVVDGVIQGISAAPAYKNAVGQVLLQELGVLPTEAFALGDSIGDKRVFELVGTSIAVNPKDGMERYATHTVYDDLRKIIPIIKEANKR